MRHVPQSSGASPTYTEVLWTLLVVVLAHFRLNDGPITDVSFCTCTARMTDDRSH